MGFKRCPICTRYLPIDDFGICNDRKDGRNLYCKACVRDKVKRNRLARKAYVAAIRAAAAVHQTDRPNQRRRDQVLNAIRDGAKTQSEIASRAGLLSEEVGDEICKLLLWTKQIATATDGEIRIYFIRPVKKALASQPINDRQRSSSFTDLGNELGPRIRGAK